MVQWSGIKWKHKFYWEKPLFFFTVKIPFSSDKAVATQASALISFPAPTAAVTSYISSWAFNSCLLLPALITVKRKLIDFVKLRMAQNVLNWSFSWWTPKSSELKSSRSRNTCLIYIIRLENWTYSHRNNHNTQTFFFLIIGADCEAAWKEQFFLR